VSLPPLLLVQDVKLPYPVLHVKGTAKYDKATKVLTVTLPVVPPPFVQRSFTAAPSLIQETESSTEAASTTNADTTSSSNGSSNTDAATSAKSVQPSEVKVVADHSRWVQEAAPSKKFDFLLQQQKLKAAQHAHVSSATDSTTAAATTATTTDGAAAGDVKAGTAAAAATAATTPAAAANGSAASSSTAELDADVSSNKEFIACAKWQGSRAGYVFKKGDNGQGYYRDAPTASATADTAASDSSATAAAATTAGASTTTITAISDAEHVYDSALHQQQQQQQQKLFKWRENERTVSIVVDVAGIDAGSVQADWQQHSISITATVTPPAAAAAAVKESLRLRLALHGAIDTARCRYDVASRNMAVVLYKAVPGFWGHLESATASSTTGSSSTSADSSTVSGGSKGTTATAAAATSTASAVQQVQQGAVALPDLTALPFKNRAMYELD
jgi:PIH1 CS-like domain